MSATRTRLEMLIGAMALGTVLWNASTACSRPTSPRPLCSTTPASEPCLAVQIGVQANAPVTFTFRNQTFSTKAGSDGKVLADLAPGSFDITGRSSATTVTIFFGSIASTVVTGVVRGSLQSIAGPPVTIPVNDPCRLTYAAGAETAKPYDFHIRFSIDTVPPFC